MKNENGWAPSVPAHRSKLKVQGSKPGDWEAIKPEGEEQRDQLYLQLRGYKDIGGIISLCFYVLVVFSLLAFWLLWL